MKYSAEGEICDPVLYKLYWSLMLEDILFHLKAEVTPQAKELLHEFHKRVLGYSTISGRKKEVVSRFITEVAIFWSVEQGIFVRTSKKQPLFIEMMDLADVWDKL